MMLLRRIYCHYCGCRSAHAKSSGTRQFQCTSCEAWNYLDKHGRIEDTPVEAINNGSNKGFESQQSSAPSYDSFSSRSQNSQTSTFCSTCEHNQRVYMETLSNYLPDDDHPQYAEYERALPKFKSDLEKRYPQICKKCAPEAQLRIHQADYDAGSKNMAHLLKSRRGAGRSRTRDSWAKRLARGTLDLAGYLAHLTVWTQAVWHIYGIGILLFGESGQDDIMLQPRSRIECLRQVQTLDFDRSCEVSLSLMLPRQCLIALCLLWYNPGLRLWYHHTLRIEAIKGQTQYFCLTLMMLVLRAYSIYKLTDPVFREGLSSSEYLAIHGTMVALLCVAEVLKHRLIWPIMYQHRFRITPKPNEVDIFASTAGPETARVAPQSSALYPDTSFNREDPRPFPIWNLAPGQREVSQRYPSPPTSSSIEGDEEDVDAMDIDWQPSEHFDMPGAPVDRTFRPRSSITQGAAMFGYNAPQSEQRQSTGWEALRSETFRIQSVVTARSANEHTGGEERSRLKYQPPTNQSPFRGHLPPAPMSMERRLRNPVSQSQFQPVPASKQENFFDQMRQSMKSGTNLTTEMKKRSIKSSDTADSDDGSMFSPAKNRTRGNLDLRKSNWELSSDRNAATGLEDIFGGNSFSIADEPAIVAEPEVVMDRATLRKAGIIAAPIALLTVIWNVQPLRRSICLWLVDILERAGL